SINSAERRSSSRCTSFSSAASAGRSTTWIQRCGSKWRKRAGFLLGARSSFWATRGSGRWAGGPPRCSRGARRGPRRAATAVSLQRLVDDLEALVDDRQALQQLFLGDAQGRVDEKVVPANEGVQAAFAKEGVEAIHRRHLISLGVVRDQRLFGGFVLHQ